MKIEHIAIWTNQLEAMKDFYVDYFQGTANQKYVNVKKKFASYFISFEDGCRLELMTMEGVPNSKDDVYAQFSGYIHMALETSSKDAVDQLTARLAKDGYACIDGPRTTGDGYYESVVLDPDQNRVELTCPVSHA
ncbi:MAG: VOC family protein [Cyclobacteriaceae bacterium]